MTSALAEVTGYIDKHRVHLERMNDDGLAGELELATCAPVTDRADLVRAAAVAIILLERAKGC